MVVFKATPNGITHESTYDYGVSVSSCYEAKISSSIDGSLIATSFIIYNQNQCIIQLSSFDNNAGSASLLDSYTISNYSGGIEFSPSGQYLYVTEPDAGKILRFDVSNGNLGTPQDMDFPRASYESLQIAPDLKEIIVVDNNGNKVGAIINPDDVDPIFISEFIEMPAGSRPGKYLPPLVPYNPGVPSISINSIQSPSCYGYCDGSIDLTNSDTSSTYYYFWSNDETTLDIDSLCAGNYFLSVYGPDGCTSVLNFYVYDPDPIEYTFTYTDSVCNCEGEAWIQTSSLFDVEWFNGDTSNYMDNLCCDSSYFFTISDTSGCEYTEYFSLNCYNIFIDSVSIVEDTCGPIGGSAWIENSNIIGGTPPYSFQWYDNDNNLISSNNTVTDLSPYAYYVVVSDSNGCQATADFAIYGSDLGYSVLIVDETCPGLADGQATLDTTNAPVVLDILWSNGESGFSIDSLSAGEYWVLVTDIDSCQSYIPFTVGIDYIFDFEIANIVDVSACDTCDGEISIDILNGVPYYSIEVNSSWIANTVNPNYSIDSLCTGYYNIMVTDSNGCYESIDSVFVDTYDSTIIYSMIQLNDCDSLNSFFIDLIVNGNNPPYEYSWSTNDTTQDITVSATGYYYVTVTDNSDCIYVDSVLVDSTSIIVAAISMTHPTCPYPPNGSMGVVVSGGLAAFDYLWSNAQTTQTINNLEDGVGYQVTVTDSYGCQATATATLNALDYLSVVADVIPPICPNTSDGEIDIVVSGGVPLYSFYWVEDGTYFSTSQNIDNLDAGSIYSLTITDDDNCQILFSGTIPQPELLVMANVIGQGCDGDTSTTSLLENATVTLNVSGGSQQLSYSWSNGETTAYLDSLIDGDTLTVTVTDNNGCTTIAPVVIESEQTVLLEKGWSNISTYLDPFETSIEQCFIDNGILNELDIIKDGVGNTYIPGSTSTLFFEVGKGYQVKMDSERNLYLTGSLACPDDNPITPNSGWDLIAYLRTSSSLVVDEFSSVVNDIIIIKEDEGLVYWPIFGLNTLVNMYPGEGYQINTSAAITFHYSDNDNNLGTKSTNRNYISQYEYYNNVSAFNNGNSMLLLIPDDAWENIPEIGTEIAVLSPEGTIVGHGVFNGSHVPVLIYGDDIYTHNKEAIEGQQQFTIETWNPETREVKSFEVNNWKMGDDKYEIGKISIVGDLKPVSQNVAELSMNCFPNPAKDMSELVVKVTGDIEASITLVDMNGKMVKKIANGNLDKGIHTYTIDLSNLSKGVFFVNLSTKTSQHSTKIVKL